MTRILGALAVVAGLFVTAATLAGCDDDTCEWGGKTYQHGESFPAGDGCNTCYCSDDGEVSCTLRGCVADAGT
jgi:hypothetical protein